MSTKLLQDLLVCKYNITFFWYCIGYDVFSGRAFILLGEEPKKVEQEELVYAIPWALWTQEIF